MHLLQEYIFTHEIRFSTFNNHQKYVINVIFYPLIKYKLINLRNLILNFSHLDFINQFILKIYFLEGQDTRDNKKMEGKKVLIFD